MAESSILIADQPGGKSVATRQANAVDDQNNSRFVQLMDTSSRIAVMHAAVSTDNADISIDLAHGDCSRVVLGVKAIGTFDKVSIFIEYLTNYNGVDTVFARDLYEIYPGFLTLSDDGYSYCPAQSYDFMGASHIVMTATCEGFGVGGEFTMYAGTI